MGNCGCGGTRLIYACSGCADVGEAADRAVRMISKTGKAKMSCLAGIGAGLDGFIKSAQAACGNVVVDGCGIACAKKTLDKLGITSQSFVLTEMGLAKGEITISDKIISDTAGKILKELKA